MLVEFKISNFRSFKDEVTFSMEPLTQNGTNPNTIDTGLKKIPQLYRTAGIFGPNASGKSNMLKAMAFIKYLSKRTPDMKVEDVWPDEHYALSDDKDIPMSFSIEVLVNDVLYKYSVSILNNIIQFESLYSTPISQKSATESCVFLRKYENNKMILEKKAKGILQRWSDETLDNKLFLSAIVNNNKCQIKEVLEVYNEINNIIVADAQTLTEGFSLNEIYKGRGDKIVSLMKNADLGLENIAVKEVSIDEIIRKYKERNEQIPSETIQNLIDKKSKVFEVKSYHKTEDGNIKEFTFDKMESRGTKAFLSLSGPFLNALENGRTILVDELDNALHPYLVQYLIYLFNNPEINKKGAQLIFTSHAHYLMDGEHLSRDQIWFTSKELNNGFYSDLYSLSDFRKLTRRNVSFYNAYMDGIYGSVPFLEKIDG